MRISKRRRMRNAQRLGWLSSSYGSTLATKLHGAQGKAGALDNEAPILAKSEDFRSYYATDYPRAMLHPGVTQEWVDEGELLSMVRVTEKLDYFSAHICLREPDKSGDKAETARRT
ncbi:hypothetical protein B296_00030520 [Ensete ventricosum]|uniref:Uncharacterized protein n=1 Tax=Ensete ventricosum TaxID=4639 RepID=A0A426XBX1_ENSVE|nr:hypothetical protein B296_00030520 [Ensete ventricosum]